MMVHDKMIGYLSRLFIWLNLKNRHKSCCTTGMRKMRLLLYFFIHILSIVTLVLVHHPKYRLVHIHNASYVYDLY